MSRTLALMGFVFVFAPHAIAQPAPSPQTGSEPPPAKPDSAPSTPDAEPTEMPSLIQELPDFTGDIWKRSYLTGDWGGARSILAENGILFDLQLTNFLQGNAYGGKDTNGFMRYSASADYYLKFDTARMKLWPGGLFTLHGETQIGDSINGKAGALMTPNYQNLLPQPNEPGLTTLSEYYMAQALSEKFVLLFGKMDLSAGDANAFAHDQRTQFMNTAFRINPILFNAGPYTALAAGAVWLPTDWLTISTFVNDNDPDGAVTRTGFNTAFHGRDWWSIAQEYAFKIKPFGLTGHQRFGWYWTSRDFIDFGGDSRVPLPVNIVGRSFLRRQFLPRWLRVIRVGNRVVELTQPEKKSDDWGLYYNFDQFVYTEPQDQEQGVGVFGRFGWTNGEANLFEQFYSIGLSGKGSVPTRDRDTWGLGYYLANITDNINPVFGLDAEQGVELYYNFEVTPWLHITPDIQIIIDPGAGFADRDPAIVYGVRAHMSL